MDVIVSRYEKNVNWTNQFKSSRVFIYNKGDNNNNNYIKLPNIGRESHTYLTHIINNYDDMSNYLCFLQDNPFDHVRREITPNGLPAFIESFSEAVLLIPAPKYVFDGRKWILIAKDCDYSNHPSMFDFYPLGLNYKCDLDGNPCNSEWYLKTTIFDKFFVDYPKNDEIFFTPGACFIVSKAAIHLRKKVFYEKILEEFNRIDEEMYFKLHPVYTGHQKMPWVLEGSWAYIFNKNFKSKYDNEI